VASDLEGRRLKNMDQNRAPTRPRWGARTVQVAGVFLLVTVLAAAGAGPLNAILRPGLLGSMDPGSVAVSCDAGGPGIDPQYPFDSLLDAELPGGIDVVGSSHNTDHALITVLHALTAGCKPVTGFGTNGTATVALTTSSPFAGIDTTTAAPPGRLLVGGTDGPDDVIGRLLADGDVDKTFAVSGWARLPRLEKVRGPPPPGPIATPLAGLVLLRTCVQTVLPSHRCSCAVPGHCQFLCR